MTSRISVSFRPIMLRFRRASFDILLQHIVEAYTDRQWLWLSKSGVLFYDTLHNA